LNSYALKISVLHEKFNINVAILVLLFVVSLINFLPVFGVLSAEKLTSAYAVNLVGNDIMILMRHRALLFGIVGGFIFFSLFKPLYQEAAMTMAAISMVGFLYFIWAADGHNDALSKIALIDVIGIICLFLAAILKYLSATSVAK
jgi:hypothetical protein